MRIIAGKFKSRRLSTLPGKNTRPMTDRMKESIFNIIGPFFDGGIVLDLFGGSGALSFEAVSRGAERAVIIEKARPALNIIKENATSLDLLDNVTIIGNDYKRAFSSLKQYASVYNIVFVDPPYAMHIVDEILENLISEDLVASGSFVICHYYLNTHIPKETNIYKIIRNTKHGASEFCIYKVK